MGEGSVAGEEITAEEETESFAPVSRVSRGMAGQGNGVQAMPEGKFIPVRDEAIRREGLEAQENPARVFDPIDVTERSAGGNPALTPIPVFRGRGDPRSVAPCEAGGVADVVEVTVGEENAAEGEVIPPPLLEGGPEGAFRPEEAGVDEIEFLPVFQDIKPHAPRV